MKINSKFNIILLFFIIILIFIAFNIFSQENLVNLSEFQSYNMDKRVSYLKTMIPKIIYEIKLIYYITLTDKPIELFSLWENSIKKSSEPQTDDLRLKRSLTLLTIFTFQGKLNYIERNFSILEQDENSNSEEISFIKSIYFLYYTFENSDNYLKAKDYIYSFILKNKMIASYFMNFTNMDRIQIIITSNFDQFIDIFTDQFLISKIKSIRSEDLKKELISKIIDRKPSFISNQIKNLLMTGSNDFNAFLINEITLKNTRFNKGEKQNLKKEFETLLKFSSSEIIHKAVYFYFSKSESDYFIQQFRLFYKKETNLLKKDLISFLLQIKNPDIYRVLLLTYNDEKEVWLKNIIFDTINIHTQESLSSEMALEFLKQFQQINENRFIQLKSRFLFYFQPDNKTNQEIRLYTIGSIDNNFIAEIDDIFSEYLSLEKDYEIFKKAIQITINHKKDNILIKLTSLITEKPIEPSEYLKLPDYYNFLCNIFNFGISESSYKKILLYFIPLLKSINDKKFTFDDSKLKELYINLDGLYSKIVNSFLSFDSSTTKLRSEIFGWADRFTLDNVTNLLLSKENDIQLLSSYINTISEYHIRESIVKGLLIAATKTDKLNEPIVNILLKLIEKNKDFDPFLTNLNETISKNKNIVSLVNYFFTKSSLFNYIYSINLIFKNPDEDCLKILYNLFQFILNNNTIENNRKEVFPFLLGFPNIQPIIYKLFEDSSISLDKKLGIIDLLGEPQFSESASSLICLLSKENVKASTKVIEIIGKMENPEKYLLVKDFVVNSFENKEIQLQFAKSSITCMSFELIPHLIKLTEYNDTEVKEAAFVALGYLPASETLPVLIKEYVKSKNPERLYRYYANSNDELREYWAKLVRKELGDIKFIDFLIKGVYPYRIFSFDEILFTNIIDIIDKPYYINTVINNIRSIPSSEIQNSLNIAPFIFIADESYYSIKYLKLIVKLNNYELAHWAILSKNQDTLINLFKILKNFKELDYIKLFDFVVKHYSMEGIQRLLPIVIKFSKSIGKNNSVDFFLRSYSLPDSYKILISLSPIKLNYEDCSKILEKNINLLPLILKLSDSDTRTYQVFINLLFKNSVIFDENLFNLTLSNCNNIMINPFSEILSIFLQNENRNSIRQIGLFYLITNLNEDYYLDQTLIELMTSSLNITNIEYFWKVIENTPNMDLTSEIVDKFIGKFYPEVFELLKRILYSKSSISNRNLLYTLFKLDKKYFFQYLESTDIYISDPLLLAKIILNSEQLDQISYQRILKSILVLPDKNKLIEYLNIPNLETLIYDIYKNNHSNINHDLSIYTLNYLISKINKVEETIQQNSSISDNQSEEKDKKRQQNYENFIISIAISNISEFEKIDYLNKFFGKSGISEKQFFEILKDLDLFKLLSKDELKNIYLIMPFVENCHDLSFMTEYYIKLFDLFNLPENILSIIIPKLDSDIIAKYIVNNSKKDIELKKFIKYNPEIILLKKELSSLLSKNEIANIYFDTKKMNFLFFFLDNSLISVDEFFSYAKTYEQKILLSNHLLHYNKLFYISLVNINNLYQFIPELKSKKLNESSNDKYIYLVKIFIYNFMNYDFVYKYKSFNTLLNLMPESLKNGKNSINLDIFDEETLNNFYEFLLLNSYIISEENLISFISNFMLPIYKGFKNTVNLDINEYKEVLKELDIKGTEEFEPIFLFSKILSILLKLYPENDIIENYIIINIKDNIELSKLFWQLVIKYKIPGLIYIFDRYYGGISWEKTRDAYLKLFK